jgi:hypothetical protein
MSDLLSFLLDFIRNILGEIPSDQAIPFFAPFYNLTVILWMAAIAAILVARARSIIVRFEMFSELHFGQ